MNIEATWYENSPYVYVVGGVVSISNYGSTIAIASGVLLMGAALAYAGWHFTRPTPP